MLKRMEGFPPWLLLVVGYVMVALLGYVDYLTGDYSMLVFYFLPIAFAGWYLGRSGALLISVGAGIARFVSDCNSYSGSAVRYWNSFQDTAFLLMVGILVALIKRKLADEPESPPES
ncbi:hypothetical protein [Geomesophilobacter sediminis]|uniref:Uncharacterized protein n=1 Tax=Geomesophilobacter sediminis TaxID=2798584 RepID=A0A8J7LYE7_9BACT|nr:hypothetical protein [Geomesophilobacter sediminis]MBJ6724672.1 hypothetical protein [Geomesophilobacter sediminis]